MSNSNTSQTLESNVPVNQDQRQITVKDAALQYLKLGFSVIPIQKGEKKPEGDTWKEFQTRIASKEEVNKWFSNTDHQLAIVCGKVSGNLFVIDFDGEGWNELCEEFLNKFPEFVAGRAVRTGSNKLHLWGMCPELPTNVTRKFRTFKGKGEIELRANGHYVLVPPSIHPSGGSYSFINEDAPIAEISLEKLMEIIN